MLTGGMPFRAENVSKLKKCILEGTYRIPQYLSEQAADIMRKLNIRAWVYTRAVDKSCYSQTPNTAICSLPDCSFSSAK